MASLAQAPSGRGNPKEAHGTLEWLWLWGPAASIVAVPMLILFSAVAKHVPALQPYAVLLQAESSNAAEISNPARFHFFAEVEDDAPTKTWLDYLRSIFDGKRRSAA